MSTIQYCRNARSHSELIVARGEARRYPRHFHARTRVWVYVVFGRAVVGIGDGERTLLSGEWFSVPPGVVHSLEIMPGSIVVCVCREEAPVPLSENDGLNAVIARITAQPEEPFSLGAMAALAGCSPWHFLRLFHNTIGMTPHAFLLASRIALARRLLRNNKTAAEAACDAGFSDQSHMHKVFFRHHGMTPREFMKQTIFAEP